jgi:hypothetical protein
MTASTTKPHPTCRKVLRDTDNTSASLRRVPGSPDHHRADPGGRGPGRDTLGIPPTGRAVTMTGTFTDRIVDGKIVESWGNSAQMALFQQIGAIQGPLAAATT